MKLQLIRKDGKIRGIAFFRGEAKIVAASEGGRSTYWRICDHCTTHEAFVFCRTHNQYVCARCIEWHGRRSVAGDFILGYACQLLSLAVVRDLAESASLQTKDEVEA